jgi:transcriptional regulator of acetoin/glycerol metabolism
VIERAVVLCGTTAAITPEHLPETVREGARAATEAPAARALTVEDETEKARLVAMIEKHRFRIGDSAKALGMPRTTLWSRMKTLGIPMSRAARAKRT